MSYSIPTLAELYDNHLSRMEGQLAQEAPAQDKSFLKVLAKTEAAEDIGLYKLAADRARANLALTAIGDDLDNIGNELSTARKAAQAAILTATLPATTGTVIPTSVDFVSDTNGLIYRPTVAATAVAGVATLSLKCSESGSDGTLELSDTLQIGTQIAGAGTVATVTAIMQEGVDKESDADYRPRVLFAERAITGGANATDHKIWAEAVTGVKRVFPYSGRPADAGTSYPGDRSVYVEATTDIDADGLAPASLLTAVRAAINYDPETGASRAPLGLTDATLFLRSISRTVFYVRVTGLDVDADTESKCKAAITAACTLYFANIYPYVDGVDIVQERCDTVTGLTVAQAIQDVLVSFGASAESVGFGVAVGVFLSVYVLGQGELAKLGSVSYA